MNIYLIERNDVVCYDEYAGAVVIAESPEQVTQMIIDEYTPDAWGGNKRVNMDVTVTKIGTANSDDAKIVLVSFNAG